MESMHCCVPNTWGPEDPTSQERAWEWRRCGWVQGFHAGVLDSLCSTAWFPEHCICSFWPPPNTRIALILISRASSDGHEYTLSSHQQQSRSDASIKCLYTKNSVENQQQRTVLRSSVICMNNRHLQHLRSMYVPESEMLWVKCCEMSEGFLMSSFVVWHNTIKLWKTHTHTYKHKNRKRRKWMCSCFIPTNCSGQKLPALVPYKNY